MSLCEAETSVAAPLTSRLQTPYAVVETIKEGRCSLITAYVLVCFTLEYAMVQLFMASVMFSYGLKVGPNTYLIHDLFFTLVLALAISRTPPQTKLGKEIPPQRFFTKYFIFKLFSQLACFPAFQLIALRSLSSQSWYEKYDPNDDDPLNAWYATENSVVAFVGLVQVMIASVVSTIGAPFRMPWYSNYSHLVCLFLQGIFVVGQLFATHNAFTSEFLDIKPMPTDYCFLLVFIMLCNIVVSVGLEVFGSKYLM